LLAWFARAARELPWRRNRDPYAIWVSEVMLQQTQVATVVGYFERFLQAFPTVAALASADEAAVLRAWEGLGYYRRARALHRAARHLWEHHQGQIPDDPALLGGLPGLGRYSVGAILSQAYDRRLPIIEANSRRVLCRLLGVEADPRDSVVQRRLWQAAETLLPRRQVGAFNQALMELGALVCTQAPDCARCPAAPFCLARQRGLQDRIPAATRRQRIEQVEEIALMVQRDSRVLLVQRPDGGRWAGMWEFPRCPVTSPDGYEKTARRLLRSLGLRAALGREVIQIRHSVTRFRITVVCFEASYRGGAFEPGDYVRGRWVSRDRLADYPSSRPQRRLAAALVKPSLF
jgi:A/G-specific adenine glycosylase